MKTYISLCKSILLLVSLTIIGYGGHKSSLDKVVPGMVIVKFISQEYLKQSGLPLSDKIMQTYNISGFKKVFQSSTDFAKTNSQLSDYQNIYYVKFSKNVSPYEVAKSISREANVIYAEPKYLHFIDATPNDSLYKLQSFYPQVKAPEAWDLVKGEVGTTVIAVVDGGTEIHHPDLSANLWQNPGEIPDNGIDDDGNGFIDDYHGWNFANNSPDPTGLSISPKNARHGTHTAGLIAAVSNNTIGVAGMSWNAQLMAINAGASFGDENIFYGFEAIIYAAENSADIISCSWGRPGVSSVFEKDIICYATELGAVVVVAAGNDNESLPHYPASYPFVLSVAAVNEDDSKSSFSNYGETIAVSAPGTSIWSTVSDFGYDTMGGTSMACPIVAGLIGLVQTLNPTWSGLQSAEQVRVTCDNIDLVNPLYAGMLGKGRINAYRALTESRPSIRLTNSRFTDQGGDSVIDPGETIQLYLTVTNYLEDANNIQLILDTDDSFLSISHDMETIAQLNTMQSLETEPFTIIIDENARAGYPAKLYLDINTAGQQDQFAFYLTIQPLFGTVSVNSIETTVTSVGRIGFAYLGYEDDGIGFKYEGGNNILYEGAIIAGTDAVHISNGARGDILADNMQWDQDFAGVTGGELQILNPGELADEQSYTVFDDRQADVPLNIRITQESYARSDLQNSDFILLKYTVENTGEQDLYNFHFGLFFDWDIATLESNKVGFDANHRLGFAYDSGEDGPETYVGAALLTDGSLSFRAIMNDETHPGNPSWGIYDGFSKIEKWEAISGGQTITTMVPGDVSFVIASGPHLIRKNRFIELGFALVAGEDSAALVTHTQAAQNLWQQLDLIDGVGQDMPNKTPYRFELRQNYPNPFNASTSIPYQLAKRSHVQLDIYSILGQHIKNLVNEIKPGGAYSVAWDGTDNKNLPVSSGIYLYKLQAENQVFVHKLLVIK
jgi:serine protease